MIRKRNSHWIFTLLTGVFSTHLYAATASVTTNKIVKDEVFQLRISADENLDSGAIDFSVLSKDFYLGRPNFGSYTNYVNGVKSVRSEWSITLAPLATGILTIPAFQVGNDTTTPIHLTVTQDTNTPQPEDLIEFQVNINHKELYPGEIAHIDTRLLIKTELRRLQEAKIVQPSIEGADKQAIELKPKGKANQYQSILNGVEVTVVDQHYDLIARQAGKYVINGPTLKGAVIGKQTANGNTRLIPVNTPSELLVIDVLEKPQNYQGVWLPSPNLTLSQKWLDENGRELTEDTQDLSLRVGTPLTREITLSAEGVEQTQLPIPHADYPDTLRVYAEKPNISQEENLVVISIKQVLIPKQQGEFTLPDITLPWWNTRTRQQAQAQLKGIHISVEKSETPSLTLSPVPPTRSDEKDIKPEIIQVDDPGFWPYLSTFFAVLWLLFTALWYTEKHRYKTNVQDTEKGEVSPALDALIRAVEKHDGIRIPAAFAQWKQEQTGADKALTAAIETEITTMMASTYTPQANSDWDNQTLLTLLKKAGKIRENKGQQSVLSSL